MSRRSAEMNNIYKKIPKQLDDEIFEQLAENENVRIERIISKGHQSPTSGWYDQEQNEWVIVLRGEAVLSFKDGSSITLKMGDYIYINAHKKHKVSWTDPNIETIWLAVHC